MQKKHQKSILLHNRIEQAIYIIRGQKVMFDEDLAELYGVLTKALNQTVNRNRERFPSDFAFQLTHEEWAILRSQFVTSKIIRGGRRYLPYVFTEQGVAMLSSVLRSPRAIAVNIEIMRTFVRLRRMAISHKELAEEVKILRTEVKKLGRKTDQRFRMIFEVLEQFMMPAEEKEQIGFKVR